MYSLNVSDLHWCIYCTSLSSYPARCSVFPPPDLSQWVFIPFISIPFIFGYASLMAAILSAFYISSFLISCLLPFSKQSDIKQSNFDLFFLRCTHCLSSALTGFKYGSPSVSWCMHEILCPFLWFVSLNISPSVSTVSLSVSFCPRRRRFPPLYLLKDATPLSLNCCVYFLLDVIAYYPIINR